MSAGEGSGRAVERGGRIPSFWRLPALRSVRTESDPGSEGNLNKPGPEDPVCGAGPVVVGVDRDPLCQSATHLNAFTRRTPRRRRCFDPLMTVPLGDNGTGRLRRLRIVSC